MYLNKHLAALTIFIALWNRLECSYTFDIAVSMVNTFHAKKMEKSSKYITETQEMALEDSKIVVDFINKSVLLEKKEFSAKMAHGITAKDIFNAGVMVIVLNCNGTRTIHGLIQDLDNTRLDQESSIIHYKETPEGAFQCVLNEGKIHSKLEFHKKDEAYVKEQYLSQSKEGLNDSILSIDSVSSGLRQHDALVFFLTMRNDNGIILL